MDVDAAGFDDAAAAHLPGLLGIHVDDEDGVLGRLEIREAHLAPNGYLHAGTVVTLADTVCGFGCLTKLPEGATGFTTIELKANFVGTATEGELEARAELVHGGRTTQVWDAEVTVAGGRRLAVFRCTQLLLYPRP